jgi:hypothetical protein
MVLLMDDTWLFRALKQYMREDGCSSSWDQRDAIENLISALDDYIGDLIDARIKALTQGQSESAAAGKSGAARENKVD